jgi:hypothetical protein
LAGIAHALQLDEAERAHLVRTASTTRPPRRRPTRQRVRPAVQRTLDPMSGTPASVVNGRPEVLAANPLGYALYSPMYADPVRPADHARFVFLGPGSTEFWRVRNKASDDSVSLLRAPSRARSSAGVPRPGRGHPGPTEPRPPPPAQTPVT